jgi:hypothetical protein
LAPKTGATQVKRDWVVLLATALDSGADVFLGLEVLGQNTPKYHIFTSNQKHASLLCVLLDVKLQKPVIDFALLTGLVIR